MGAAEYLEELEERFKKLSLLAANGRLLGRTITEEYFETRDKLRRLHGEDLKTKIHHF